VALTAGTPRKIHGEYRLDDAALAGSMALVIDNEMKALYEKIKGTTMPDTGLEDRRMLFTAVARGILKYLKNHAGDLLSSITITHDDGSGIAHSATTETDLDIHVDEIPL
jgi:hypothetical protein